MSNFGFFELIPEVAEKLHLQPLPVPIRRERQLDIFPEGRDADLPGILDEIEIFLLEKPHYTDVYRLFLAQLCYIVGIDAATQGYHTQAIHYFRMGLDAEPENVSLRSNYALALHCAELFAEARREYERVIATTDKDKILPLVWIMLARIYAQENEYEKAYWLLKDVSMLIPDEDGFWDFFGEMEEKAGLNKEPESAPSLDSGSGAKVEAFPPSIPLQPEVYHYVNSTSGCQAMFCPKCNAPLAPDDNFCGNCGSPLGQQ